MGRVGAGDPGEQMTRASDNRKQGTLGATESTPCEARGDRLVLLIGHMLAANHRSKQNMVCSLVDTGQLFAFQ